MGKNMARRIPEYVKYTKAELDSYTNASGSCVKKVNTILHLSILPSDLNNFTKTLPALLSTKKIGSYEEKLKGIVLDMRNIKLLSNSGAIRTDDPRIHVNIRSDCYIFQPSIGAIVRGTVRHMSSAQIGVIIYRVFSVSIRLLNKAEETIDVDSEIDFRIKKYNLETDFPYIEGELVEKIEIGENKLKIPKTELNNSDACGDIVKLIKEIKQETEEIKSPKKRRKTRNEKVIEIMT